MENNLSGFYRLTISERLKKLKEVAHLTPAEIKALLNGGALSSSKADKLIENVIGVVHLPLGLATNFVINRKPMLVPMAIEEASVVAAASKAAKQTLPEGFSATADDSVMIGQIQLVSLSDPKKVLQIFSSNKKRIINLVEEQLKPKRKYGCTVHDVGARILETERGRMLVLDFQISVGNAQGANIINTALEAISPLIREIIDGKIRLRILSNLATKRLARAQAIWKKEIVGEEVIEGVLDAYAFATADIYRCATHNKGIMNGIDAVAVATGNDWRSIEAGAHAFAAQNQYKPLTCYKKTAAGDLFGSIELPLAVGMVGPAIAASSTALISLKILNVGSSQELAMVMASVGLANNFAALAALSTEGIQKGHMKLHARNIALHVGAHIDEVDKIANILSSENKFDEAYVKQVILKVRKK